MRYAGHGADLLQHRAIDVVDHQIHLRYLVAALRRKRHLHGARRVGAGRAHERLRIVDQPLGGDGRVRDGDAAQENLAGFLRQHRAQRIDADRPHGSNSKGSDTSQRLMLPAT